MIYHVENLKAGSGNKRSKGTTSLTILSSVLQMRKNKQKGADVKVAYVIGRLTGEVEEDGRITAKYENMEVRQGPRPKTAEEYDGIPEQLEILNSRLPGAQFDTPARLGAGGALVIPDIFALSFGDNAEKRIQRIKDQWGDFHPDTSALIGPLRDIDAPVNGPWTDTCAGVAGVPDILVSAFREIVEVGFNIVGDQSGDRLVGYYQLPEAYKNYQVFVDEETKKEWDRLAGTSGGMKYIPVAPMSLDTADEINGISAVLSAEPSSLEVMIPLKVELKGHGWFVRDTEHRPGPDNTWTPCDRQIQAIVRRAGGKSPIMLSFGPYGLNGKAHIIALSGEALVTNINAKVRSMLWALGRIPKLLVPA